MTDPQRRRRRVRRVSSEGPPEVEFGSAVESVDSPHVRFAAAAPHAANQPLEYLSAQTTAVHDPDPADEGEPERGLLRNLVGSGSSQVSPSAALRARDAARPTEADLAEAAEHLVVVRRGWVPRDSLPRSANRSDQ